MNNIQLFNNPEFGQIRTITDNNDIYFVGKDVAEILGYASASKAVLDHVDEEDRTVLSSQNGNLENIPNRGLTVINESGLYSLVLSSKLPSAKRFKRWVTSEVLPALRRQGGYMLANANETPEQIMARAQDCRRSAQAQRRDHRGNEAKSALRRRSRRIRQYVSCGRACKDATAKRRGHRSE